MKKLTLFGTIGALALDLLAMTAGPASAGAVDGPFEKHGCLPAKGCASYKLSFEKCRYAYAEAYACGDIDIYVYDHCGKLVAVDDECDGQPAVRFNPHYDWYTIKIVNRECHRVEFDLRTN